MNTIVVAILSRIPLDAIVSFVLSVLLKAMPGLWETTKKLVQAAESRFPEPGAGSDKSAWVRVELLHWLGKEFGIAASAVKQHVLDSVIGLAVAELQRRMKKTVGLEDLVRK